MTTGPGRRWGVATVTALVTVVVVGVPTVLIPNPWFGRQVEPTWWAWPVLVVTAMLSGLVTATYVRAGYALHRRLAGEKACPLPAARRSADVPG
jgi:hypothetical protein